MSTHPPKENMVIQGATMSTNDLTRLSISNYNPTVRENIDGKIKSLHAELERLEKAKIDLEKTQLLDIHIQDLRNAMNY